ncbi:DNA polymerase III subunit alpha [Dokdonia sp. Dokd-P16]|uniref:DNA polymerase III subunit alpha n=1 Tax=Dokdonia sp. Dokd-P16 TaxID=2173169 RepID=UPI000D54816F|nr:DNA polymerase III subunit alpha [Dokdonia sp. Dokd-P16]AWH73289.1 DNA polymerase III subunit alpha [Dokdonia sp. Dokd-P16]
MYLNNHSYFSLRYGTISEEELLDLAIHEGCTHFALTDINNTSGCLNFVRRAKEKNIKPIIGVDFRNNTKQCYVALAMNNQGFLEINNYLSKHLHNKTPFPDQAPHFENVAIIYPFENVMELGKVTFASNEYIGVRAKDIYKLKFSSLSSLTKKLVILHTVSFRDKRDFNTHRLLRAIDTNVLLSTLALTDQGSPNDLMYSRKEIAQVFKDYPSLVENTNNLLRECKIDFNFSKDKPSQNLTRLLESPEADYKKLLELCEKGLKDRYEVVDKIIKDRLKKELDLIKQLDYVAFFLINWKIIEYARSKDYYYVGRGSGANSIVAYLLRITDVDPIELDLYFERFMNLYRATPPDFDIDFSTWDREDITDYIFKEFKGNNQVALLGSYVTFKHSGAVRELGKVFGLPKYEIDKLSDGRYDPNSLDDIKKLVLKYAQVLHGRPNYTSIHAAGILISSKPIHYFSATNLPPKGFPTVQFDMHIAEDVGLYKFDILGQRGLGKIKDAFAIIKQNNPRVTLPDIHNAKQFFTDDRINEMISQADCIGCFYVESPAMRMLLKKLGVRDYLTLVAASSIIRPGVSKSGMMREYILRHKDPKRAKQNGHPVLLRIMPDTYGVMVYQEDVIKVAHHYAGLDLGEADVLRRGMSGKYRSREEFLQVKEKFKNNCLSKGESIAVVNEVWRQIESFAGYAFAKGHSASYAVESYQSLYLKCYFPLEYMVATINNGGGFYRTETYVHEAKKKGATVHPPCINTSDIQTTIHGKDIYLGFQHLQTFEKKNIVLIVNARIDGPFKSLDDFLERVPISLDQLDLLIRVEAFRSIKDNQRSLLWEAHYKNNARPSIHNQKELFKVSITNFKLPEFYIPDVEKAFDQIEILSLSLYDPFILLESKPTIKILAKDLYLHLNKTVVIYGYLVTAKNTGTSNGNRMCFGTFLDYNGDWIDTVHFPPSLKQYPIQGKAVYKITGKVVAEFDFMTIEVTTLERQHYRSDTKTTAFYNPKGTPKEKNNYSPFKLIK